MEMISILMKGVGKYVSLCHKSLIKEKRLIISKLVELMQ